MAREINKAQRPSRTPINGRRSILSVKGKDPDYEYRIVNDEGDRVALFQEQGYEVVTDPNVMVGERRVGKPGQEGTPVKVSVGNGQQAYLMRIRKDWFEEDQQAKLDSIREQEASLEADAHRAADYGKFKVSRD